jgi:hypothetical protein
MSTLERHCQLLLRAYPAAYRDVRGEEIVGTLLEATPPERSWPWPRDSRGLILGGLRARATFNRRLTTGANLRTALLAGVAGYLTYNALAVLGFEYFAEVSVPGHIHPVLRAGATVLASALTLLTVGLVFLTSRRALVLAAALPAVALTAYVGSWRTGAGGTAFHLALLAALVALVRGSQRPSRRWLLLVGLLAVSAVVPYITPPFGYFSLAGMLLAVAGVSLAWAVIDARPAIAVIAFFLGLYLPTAVEELTTGAFPVFVLPYLAVLTGIAAPAVWLLRRQSAHGGRPTRE